MIHKLKLDCIIFWISILTVVVYSHEVNEILTDSNDLQCTDIQCPTKCPRDSYLKFDDEDEDFDDYEDELFDHDSSYMDHMGHMEGLTSEEKLHDNHSPEHILKARQKREVYFHDDLERCCDGQKCVCNKCEDVPKCPDGQVAVEIHEGTGVPGNCCSIYKCVGKEVCQLGVKQTWWRNKCTKCSCFGETDLCMHMCAEEEILQNCYSVYWQKPMMNGAHWKEGSCTSCSCEQGDRRCLTPVCPKLECKETIVYEDECCPKCKDADTDNVTHQTSSPKMVSSTASTIMEDILTTFQPDAFETFNKNIFNAQHTTSSPLTISNSSTVTSSTKDTQFETTIRTTTAEPNTTTIESEYDGIQKPKEILEQNGGTTTEIPLEEATQDTFSSISSFSSSKTFDSETTTASKFTDSMESSTPADNILQSLKPTTATTLVSSISSITAGPTKTIMPLETSPSSITSTMTSTAASDTTNTPLDQSTSSPATLLIPKYATTSTTSAPYPAAIKTTIRTTPYLLYSATTDSTTTSGHLEESTTTSAPEPLKPVFQSYGDLTTNERATNTQNQMRLMLHQIDYVIIIVLLIGSLLCLSLGLIIRHTKNRKKMYSSIPSSETSLSQTSTNTVLTV